MSLDALEKYEDENRNLYASGINRIVDKTFPDILNGLETLLKENSVGGDNGRN